MIQFVLLFSRQGKLRLQKWFDAYQVNYLLWLNPTWLPNWVDLFCTFWCLYLSAVFHLSEFWCTALAGQLQEKDLQRTNLKHPCTEAEDVQLYRVERAQDCLQEIRQSLLLCGNWRKIDCQCIIQISDDPQAADNELIALEIIHRYVELLDKYFGSVSSFL